MSDAEAPPLPEEVVINESHAHTPEGHICGPECSHGAAEADTVADQLFSSLNNESGLNNSLVLVDSKPALHEHDHPKRHECAPNCACSGAEADNIADNLFAALDTHDPAVETKADNSHEHGHVCGPECHHNALEADKFADNLFADLASAEGQPTEENALAVSHDSDPKISRVDASQRDEHDHSENPGSNQQTQPGQATESPETNHDTSQSVGSEATPADSHKSVKEDVRAAKAPSIDRAGKEEDARHMPAQEKQTTIYKKPESTPMAIDAAEPRSGTDKEDFASQSDVDVEAPQNSSEKRLDRSKTTAYAKIETEPKFENIDVPQDIDTMINSIYDDKVVSGEITDLPVGTEATINSKELSLGSEDLELPKIGESEVTVEFAVEKSEGAPEDLPKTTEEVVEKIPELEAIEQIIPLLIETFAQPHGQESTSSVEPDIVGTNNTDEQSNSEWSAKQELIKDAQPVLEDVIELLDNQLDALEASSGLRLEPKAVEQETWDEMIKKLRDLSKKLKLGENALLEALDIDPDNPEMDANTFAILKGMKKWLSMELSFDFSIAQTSSTPQSADDDPINKHRSIGRTILSIFHNTRLAKPKLSTI